MGIRGDQVKDTLPGEIFVNNFQITIILEEKSASAWKKAIKQTYKTVIIGSQKSTTNLNMKVPSYLYKYWHECSALQEVAIQVFNWQQR